MKTAYQEVIETLAELANEYEAETDQEFEPVEGLSFIDQYFNSIFEDR